MKKIAIILLTALSLSCTEKDTSNTRNKQEYSCPEGMVFVKGGNFMMANPSKDKTGLYHLVAHTTVVRRDFCIGKAPVTQKEWKKIMGNNPSHFKNCEECPVEQVSYDDTQKFILKLNVETGKEYRLPTNSEWELAATNGKHRQYRYSGSNDLDEVGWFSGNSDKSTHPVCQKTVNELGLCDMSGNVWEWVSPTLNRGGSWSNDAPYCRVVSGYFLNSDSVRSNNLGFRLALTPAGAEQKYISIMETDGLRSIYRNYSKIKPGFKGEVKLKLTFAPSGEVVSADIVSSTTGYAEFDDAIKKRAGTWKFSPSKDSTNTTATIPLYFGKK